ncbi:hypothetical protein StrepF001_12990 [Streptomyces sp. F001]|uniref:hypothetical protein n=1 Tax=Streptomyces sp. F001 TaxID=1510026 RepID=UPI00101E463C|nr:hypothetical protein [Streptomyces sp. F001]RZB19635.1 hypothetical protein StrepF001_12990 [Streptomyces sp. F001]
MTVIGGLLDSVVELDEVQVADGHGGLLLVGGQGAEEVGLADAVGEDVAQFVFFGIAVAGVEEVAGVVGGQVLDDTQQTGVVEFAAEGGVGETSVELGGDAAAVVEDLLMRTAADIRLPGAVDLALDEGGCRPRPTG